VAAPLKDGFGPDVPARIAAMLAAADPAFPAAAFTAEALDGFADLELTGRARHVAAALGRHLPAGFPRAADLVEGSLGPVLPLEGTWGMAPFLYLPHVYWVAEAGLDHPERALALQHALTQRFTAEFSIRAYLLRHPDLTLATLRGWTADPSAHVRRLVSEGTRPRLPWAARLAPFVRDPAPVLPLLEALRDDPAEYVRRSVANNLNDIGKDHPDVLRAVARRWGGPGAPPARRRLLRHALRSLVRAGDPEALALVGMDVRAEVCVEDLRLDPPAPVIGGHVDIACRVRVRGGPAAVLVHARVHFAGARGPRPRTFVMGEARLGPGDEAALRTRVTLRQLTTRRHLPGAHPVEILVNGRVLAEGTFRLESPA